jgi:hypothetical protein
MEDTPKYTTDERVVPFYKPQLKRTLTTRAQIKQETLGDLLEASRLVQLAEEQIARELENGATVEEGQHTARLVKLRRGRLIIRKLVLA